MKVTLINSFYVVIAAAITSLLFGIFKGAVSGVNAKDTQLGVLILSVVFLYPFNLAICFFLSQHSAQKSNINYIYVGTAIWFSSAAVISIFSGVIPLLILLLLIVSMLGGHNGANKSKLNKKVVRDSGAVAPPPHT